MLTLGIVMVNLSNAQESKQASAMRMRASCACLMRMRMRAHSALRSLLVRSLLPFAHGHAQAELYHTRLSGAVLCGAVFQVTREYS